MRTVPAGSYIMGSSVREHRELGVPERFDEMETPRHRVVIRRPFAIGRYAVTFAQWDRCLASGGCSGYRPSDAGWGRGRHPVINVNWSDAQSFVRWLSQESQRTYRLLSEAEWEYAARGGTGGYYYTGNRLRDADANFGGLWGRTLEVGHFPPNPFGLYDMSGNTAQWVQDCYHESYRGAPNDGSAWLDGPCRLRNVRGGAWSLHAWSARAAQRIGDPPDARNDHLGFRVARDLQPEEIAVDPR